MLGYMREIERIFRDLGDSGKSLAVNFRTDSRAIVRPEDGLLRLWGKSKSPARWPRFEPLVERVGLTTGLATSCAQDTRLQRRIASLKRALEFGDRSIV